MGKQVFLCWSGARSHEVASALEKALEWPEIALEPFLSESLEKGSLWIRELGSRLQQADAAILCLTPENARAPWIHFEAGALAARMWDGGSEAKKTSVFPYCLQMEGMAIDAPLGQFQITHASRGETRRLIGDLLEEAELEAFEKIENDWWAELESALHTAEDLPVTQAFDDLEEIFCRNTFREPLADCVDQHWAERWYGAMETRERLRSRSEQVGPQLRPFAVELLDQLYGHVNSYATSLTLLLDRKGFDLGDDGKRMIDTGIHAACEDRRKKANKALRALVDPRREPVFDESPAYAILEQFDEKKSLVHRLESWLEHDRKEPWRWARAIENPDAVNSDWEFDRIAFYLVKEAAEVPPEPGSAVDWLRRELERLNAAPGLPSHMPLTYCLGALKESLRKHGPDAIRVGDVRALLVDARTRGEDRRGKDVPAPGPLEIHANEVLDLLPDPEPATGANAAADDAP